MIKRKSIPCEDMYENYLTLFTVGKNNDGFFLHHKITLLDYNESDAKLCFLMSVISDCGLINDPYESCLLFKQNITYLDYIELFGKDKYGSPNKIYNFHLYLYDCGQRYEINFKDAS